MWFGGFQPLTLSDYPATVAAIVFAQGCNFRCRFCHNCTLLPLPSGGEGLMAEEEVVSTLEQRKGKLEGLVVSGGEPTLQADLPEFLARVRELGYKIKLDSNGSRPEMVKSLLREGLLDYVAMDIKAPFHEYARICGVAVDTDAIGASIALIAASGVAHHFRTTFVEALMTPEDLEEAKRLVPVGSRHIVQKFQPEHALDPGLRYGSSNS